MASRNSHEEPVSSSNASTDHKHEEKTGEEVKPAEEEYPTSWKKISIIMVALYLTMFLVALDRTIIGTAIPAITDQFHSIKDVGWYASAYLITGSAFQLIYGRIYTFYSAKWVMLSAIGLFELGSAVCGAAPSSTALIIGRAIAGCGGAGILSGAITIMLNTIPLHKRPLFQGLFGAVFGIASVCGPYLGGVFTTHVSWRWCFYLNLPIGAVVVAILLFILDAEKVEKKYTIREKIMQLDPWGNLFFMPGVLCLLLALQWGGTTYAWGNARIIVLFIVAFICLSIFIYIQFRVGENATIPIRILKQRTIIAASFIQFFLSGVMIVFIYYIPLWFQAIKGVDAVQSGVNIFPLVISLVLASIMSGGLTNKTGYYVPQAIASAIMTAIGGGLVTTFNPSTSSSKWIGYQVLLGFGIGFGMQIASTAAQTVLSKRDAKMGVSFLFFIQGIGGSIWVSIAQLLFTSHLSKGLQSLSRSTHISVDTIVNTGATELKRLIPAAQFRDLLSVYNEALRQAFILSTALAAVLVFFALALEWRSIKGLKEGGSKVESERRGSRDGGEKVKGEENV